MDDFQAREINSLRARHESLCGSGRAYPAAHRLRDPAARFWRSDSVGMYAEDIEASARRIVARVTALEAIADAVGILETHAEDSAPAGGK